MKNFVVIGSGPIGTIVSKYLLEKNYEVTMVDNSKECKVKNSKSFTFKKIENNIFSEFYINKINSKTALPVGSKNKGGFSEVWGGTLNELNYRDLESWEEDYEEIFKNFEYIINSLELPVEKYGKSRLKSTMENYDEIINIISNNLSDKLSKSNIIEFEKSKLFLNKHGSVWNAKEQLELLEKKYKKFKYINDFEVINISQREECNIIQSHTDSISFHNSKLIIATGPFPSSFLASKLTQSNTFILESSDLRVVPLFWLGKGCKSKSSQSFPQLFLNYEDKHKVVNRGQIYVLNHKIIESLGPDISKLTKFLLYALEAIFTNRIHLLFLYDHSNNSTCYEFIRDGNKISTLNIVKNKNASVFYFFKLLINNLYKFKFLPIPIHKKFKPYGSFHIGATKFKIKDQYTNKFNKDGSVDNYEDIHFVDASVFNNIPSGPTTFLSMALAISKINQILKAR